MKCLRILPEICASTLPCPGRSTRNIVPGNTCVTVPSVTICSSFATGRNILPTSASLNQRGQFAILLALFKRNGRQIFAQLSAFPPCASLSMFFRRSESITIQDRADIARWQIWEWVMGKQPSDIRLSLEQTNGEPDKPGILLWSSQRGEPHLPIEPGLMWRTPARGAVYGARFPSEFVRQPIDSIGAAFDHNLAAIFRHYAKQAVAVHDPERFEMLVCEQIGRASCRER